MTRPLGFLAATCFRISLSSSITAVDSTLVLAPALSKHSQATPSASCSKRQLLSAMGDSGCSYRCREKRANHDNAPQGQQAGLVGGELAVFQPGETGTGRHLEQARADLLVYPGHALVTGVVLAGLGA